MSSYLVVNNQSYECYPFANSPYMVVNNECLPMTSETSTDMPRATNSTTQYQITQYPSEVYETDTYTSEFTIWTGVTTTSGTGTGSMLVTLEYMNSTYSASNTSSNPVSGQYSYSQAYTFHAIAVDTQSVSMTVSNSIEVPTGYVSTVSSTNSSVFCRTLIASRGSDGVYTTGYYNSAAHYLFEESRFSNDTICISDSNSSTEYYYDSYVTSSETTVTYSNAIFKNSYTESKEDTVSVYMFTGVGAESTTMSSTTSDATCSESTTIESTVTETTATIPVQLTSTTFTGYKGTATRTTGTYTSKFNFTGSHGWTHTSRYEEGNTVIAPGQYSVTTWSGSGVTHTNNFGSVFGSVELFDATRTIEYMDSVAPFPPRDTATVSTYLNNALYFIAAQTIHHPDLEEDMSIATEMYSKDVRCSVSSTTYTFTRAEMLDSTSAKTSQVSSTYKFDVTYMNTLSTTGSYTITSSESNQSCSQTFSGTKAVLEATSTSSMTSTATTEGYTVTTTSYVEGVTSYAAPYPVPVGEFTSSYTSTALLSSIVNSSRNRVMANNLYFLLPASIYTTYVSLHNEFSGSYADGEQTTLYNTIYRINTFAANVQPKYTSALEEFGQSASFIKSSGAFTKYEYDSNMNSISSSLTTYTNSAKTWYTATWYRSTTTAAYNASEYDAFSLDYKYSSASNITYSISTDAATEVVTETIYTTSSESIVTNSTTYEPLP